MLSENYKQKIRESVKTTYSVMGIDDEEVINELVEVAIESLNQELAAIEEILNSDDISQLGFHTHTIKGVLGNVGLKEDANIFQEIKHLSEQGKTDEEIKEITRQRIAIFKE